MNWVAELLIQQKGKKIEVMKIGDIISLGRKWRGNIICLDQMLYEDAKKEFRLDSMTDFGKDRNKTIQILILRG